MIEGIPVAALTPWGIVLVVALLPYILVARGKLIPRSTYEDIIRDRDHWRAAHGVSEETRATQTAQVSELLEHARVTTTILRALPRPSEHA